MTYVITLIWQLLSDNNESGIWRFLRVQKITFISSFYLSSLQTTHDQIAYIGMMMQMMIKMVIGQMKDV